MKVPLAGRERCPGLARAVAWCRGLPACMHGSAVRQRRMLRAQAWLMKMLVCTGWSVQLNTSQVRRISRADVLVSHAWRDFRKPAAASA